MSKMITGKAILVVDLGNSSTKAEVKYSKGSDGVYKTCEFELSHTFALIDDAYVVSEDYTEDNSTILTVDTELGGKTISGAFCNGLLQEREFPTGVIRPSAIQKKYSLDSTVLSCRLALIQAYRAIMKAEGLTSVSEINVVWSVLTLLPPGDVDAGRESLEDLIRNIKYVRSTLPLVEREITIKDVLVLPEGYCAYAGLIFDDKGKLRSDPKFLNLAKSTVLVIDIGAGTTDLLMIKANKLVQKSKATLNYGGTKVERLLIRDLRSMGLDLDADVVKEGLLTGEVMDGASTLPVADLVNKAKEEIAILIVNGIRDYFEETDIKIRSISYVVVCGGGSMKGSNCEVIQPLSRKVVEALLALNPNVEYVDMPMQTRTITGVDGYRQTIEEEVSPRMLNLAGASAIASSRL